MSHKRAASRQSRLETLAAVHPNAAGLASGSETIVVAVPPDRAAQPVRAFDGLPSNDQCSAAALRPSPTPPSVGLVQLLKRKKRPILHAARRSTATRCWAAACFRALGRDLI